MQGHRATVASAGHPPLFLLRRRGDVERIFHTGPALGLHPEADFAQHEVVLEPGDRLLFYSDGLYDWIPGEGGSPGDEIAARLEREGARAAEGLEGLLALPEIPGARSDEPPRDDVTLLMLDASPGESQLDNGMLSPLPAPVPERTTFEILFGSDSRRTTFSVQGRAEWELTAAFHDECVAAMEAGRDVLIDLALCQNLDSTFLGTIHELSERAAQAHVELRLQGVTPTVEGLFTELGMKRVIERIVERTLPLPTHMEPLVGSADPRARALQLLRAHESLAGLSDRNRQEFDPVLELLRREVAAESQ
jgi:anti-anti-sigma regulatory factor